MAMITAMVITTIPKNKLTFALNAEFNDWVVFQKEADRR
ncbi:MAG: hypothetical protein ACI83W_000624 [Marinoscillum sp.]|jgi:hypothetical protein